ncbi:MAG: dihydrolipoyl dehydrogenase [Candidatus Marinimicrobia bacterium]|nr:dihydrolipoyl dehydrogenase [Candidatus Neomarinimicrobiota bacterium]
MNIKKLLILITIAVTAFTIYNYFDIGQYLNFTELKNQQAGIQEYYQNHQWIMLAGYFALYVFATAISIPGAVVLTIAGGAIFGFLKGLIVISFASSIGATIAFLFSRYILRDAIQSKFGDKLKTINEGIEKEGGFYLFTLRLIPIFPFFMINLIFGLTPMRALSYYGVSQIGMLAGTAVYVNAGTQLAQLESVSGILSLELLFSFILLGIFPWIAKLIVNNYRKRQVYKGYSKPKKFDYNIVVIGAGSGGLVSAYIASAVKAKVALIEKHKMGGDCLNTGCVPSKALIRSAKLIHQIQKAEKWGLDKHDVKFDFATVMERVQSVIKQVEPHDSVDRYTKLDVDVIEGTATITDPWRIEVDGKIITSKNIVIAAGARPLLPPIPGIKEINPLTSDTIWNIRKLPKRLVVVGGGPIGSELTHVFARLGSKVTQIEGTSQILNREDSEVSSLLAEQFKNEGIDLKTNHRVIRFEKNGESKIVVCESDGKEIRIECDEVLVALGRKANVTGYGLEELEIKIRPNGTIEADDYLRTKYPNIYAVGDVTGPYQFTHFSAHQAWYASVNSLFSPLKKFKTDYRVIPWVTFTDPEVARVGLNEKEANEKGIEFEVTKYGIDDLDRAIADGENIGFVKIITPKGKDTILGVTIVGSHAGEYLTEFTLAMKHGLGLNKILGTIHPYPTWGESNKYAAGEWKRNHAPQKALRYLQKFHSWRRG